MLDKCDAMGPFLEVESIPKKHHLHRFCRRQPFYFENAGLAVFFYSEYP